ncbi:NUDIX hydrolase [Haladaptatus salinisoli]|uniref:NUDIX hydrolase n=1 Tax=Haladaptatus salinisoli TaxID=2884876 RepID=UPI001D0ADD11|nr:NUDIX domain-containing protein [Haladaptatus salinisoli]
MSENRIRVSARGLVRRGDEILVARDRDPAEGERFHYLLGGGVEFGEHSEDALHREFEEELGVSLANVSPFETYEGVFTFDGRRAHEVWRVYEADIAESWPYERDSFPGYEPEFDEEFECLWKSPSDFAVAGETLYPESLLSDI